MQYFAELDIEQSKLSCYNKVQYAYKTKKRAGQDAQRGICANESREGERQRMNAATGQDKKPAYAGVYNRFIKRGLDIVVSGTAIVLLAPLYLVIGVMIAVEDGSPVLYRAERGGYQGQPFRICKFRTMVRNADRIGGGTTSFHDPRITKSGNFLRKTKLDELPQLGQVFLGKMSIVGPRPELLRYVEQYRGEELDILRVRPGITDFSSVQFINLDEIVGDENADDMYERYVLKRKNALRVKYAHTVSFKTDASILWMTVRAVLGKVYGYVFRRKHR